MTTLRRFELVAAYAWLVLCGAFLCEPNLVGASAAALIAACLLCIKE